MENKSGGFDGFQRAVFDLVLDSSVPHEFRAELLRVMRDCGRLISSSKSEAWIGPELCDGFTERFLAPSTGFWCGVSQALDNLGGYEEREDYPLNLRRYEALRRLIRVFAISGRNLPERTLEEKGITQAKIAQKLGEAATAMKRDPFFESLTCEDLSALSPLELKRKKSLSRLMGNLGQLRRKYIDAKKSDIPNELLGVLAAFNEYQSYGWSSESLAQGLKGLAFQSEMSSQSAEWVHKSRAKPEVISLHYWADGMTRYKWERRVNNMTYQAPLLENAPHQMELEGGPVCGVLFGDWEPIPPSLPHRSQEKGSSGKYESDRAKVFAADLLDWFKTDCGCSRLHYGAKGQIAKLTGVAASSLKHLY